MSISVKGNSSNSLDITNGILKEYYAQSGEIAPNTFVEYADTGANTPLNMTNSCQVPSISFDCIIPLSDNKFFIAYQYTASTSDSDLHVQCSIVEINGNNLTIIDNARVSYGDTSSHVNCINSVRLTDNKILLVYSVKSTSKYHSLYGCVLTLNNNSIEGTPYESYGAGTYVGYDGTRNEYNVNALEKLDDNTAILGFLNASDIGILKIVNINETEISSGTEVSLSSSAIDGLKICTMDDNKFVAIFVDYYNVWMSICEVSGTTITTGDAILLTNDDSNKKTLLGCFLLQNGDLFIIYGMLNKIYYGIYEIGNNEIVTKCTDLCMDINCSYTCDEYTTRICRISDNQFFIAYRVDIDTDHNFYGTTITVGENNLSVGASAKLIDFIKSTFTSSTGYGYFDIAKLSDNLVIAIYDDYDKVSTPINGTSDAYCYLKVVSFTVVPSIKLPQNGIALKGFTKTKATTTTKGKVWVYNPQ